MKDLIQEHIELVESTKIAIESIDAETDRAKKLRADGLKFVESVRQYLEAGRSLTAMQAHALSNFRSAVPYHRKRAQRQLGSADIAYIADASENGATYREIATRLASQGVVSKTGRPVTQPILSRFMIENGGRMRGPYTKVAPARRIEGPNRDPKPLIEAAGRAIAALHGDGGTIGTPPAQQSLEIGDQKDFMTQLDEIMNAPVRRAWKETLIRALVATTKKQE